MIFVLLVSEISRLSPLLSLKNVNGKHHKMKTDKSFPYISVHSALLNHAWNYICSINRVVYLVHDYLMRAWNAFRTPYLLGKVYFSLV